LNAQAIALVIFFGTLMLMLLFLTSGPCGGIGFPDLFSARATRVDAAPRPLSASRKFLIEYWGARWPTVEAEFRSQRKDIDRLGQIVVSKEDAELELRDRFRLSDAERAQLRVTLRAARDVRDANLGPLVARRQAAIDALVDEYLDQLDREIRIAWSRGAGALDPYMKSNTSTARNSKPFYEASHTYAGWVGSVSLSGAEHMLLSEIQAAILALVHARDQEIAEHAAKASQVK
jgi:hypothetical protein